jgi:hypothetical protein
LNAIVTGGFFHLSVRAAEKQKIFSDSVGTGFSLINGFFWVSLPFTVLSYDDEKSSCFGSCK